MCLLLLTNKHIAVGGMGDHSVSIFDSVKKVVHGVLSKKHTGNVTVLMQKGKFLISGSLDRTMHIYLVDDIRYRFVKTLVTDHFIDAIIEGPGDCVIEGGSHKGRIKVWDVITYFE